MVWFWCFVLICCFGCLALLGGGLELFVFVLVCWFLVVLFNDLGFTGACLLCSLVSLDRYLILDDCCCLLVIV